MRDQPVLICFWYDSGGPRTVQSMLRRSKTPAEVRVAVAESVADFLKALGDWYTSSNNTQQLIIVSHGIQDADTNEWIGLGVDGADGYFVHWDQLWDAVVRPKTKPPRLLLLGCRSSDAAEHLQSSLTARWNNPPLVGLSEVVDDDSILAVTRVAVQLLRNMSNLEVSLDNELATLRPLFSAVRMHHPIRLVKRSPRYVDVDQLLQEIGMTYRQYLEWENQEIARESNQRRERRSKTT